MLDLLYSLLFIVTIAAMFRARGTGKVPKYLPLLYLVLPCYLYTDDVLLSIIVPLGLVLFAIDGVGRGLLAVHGWSRVYISREGYKWYIDGILILFQPKGVRLIPHVNVRVRFYGMLWMSLRGLYIAPLFIGLGWYLNGYIAVLIGVSVGLLMGVVYWLAGIKHTKHSHALAEWLYGFILGVGIVSVL